MISDDVIRRFEDSASSTLERMIVEQEWEDVVSPITVNITLTADDHDKYYLSSVVATILAGDFIATVVDVKAISLDEFISLNAPQVDPSLN